MIADVAVFQELRQYGAHTEVFVHSRNRPSCHERASQTEISGLSLVELAGLRSFSTLEPKTAYSSRFSSPRQLQFARYKLC